MAYLAATLRTVGLAPARTREWKEGRGQPRARATTEQSEPSVRSDRVLFLAVIVSTVIDPWLSRDAYDELPTLGTFNAQIQLFAPGDLVTRLGESSLAEALHR